MRAVPVNPSPAAGWTAASPTNLTHQPPEPNRLMGSISMDYPEPTSTCATASLSQKSLGQALVPREKQKCDGYHRGPWLLRRRYKTAIGGLNDASRKTGYRDAQIADSLFRCCCGRHGDCFVAHQRLRK